MRVGLLTISTSRADGEAVDQGGPALARFVAGYEAEVVAHEVIPDDLELIEERLRHFADEVGCQLVLTTGGTGFAPSDVTPEATRAVVDRLAPGVSEAMRLASRDYTTHWMLSRAVAGIRGGTLIINFPGSPSSIAEAGDAIAEALPHALELLTGEAGRHEDHD